MFRFQEPAARAFNLRVTADWADRVDSWGPVAVSPFVRRFAAEVTQLAAPPVLTDRVVELASGTGPLGPRTANRLRRGAIVLLGLGGFDAMAFAGGDAGRPPMTMPDGLMISDNQMMTCGRQAGR